ncbi:hypothetical protein AB0J74_10205 [Asanoa sp. NPDC049573]|uniref:hypothetical protein n=1 Tax=Asanoa sp. NPDC049573 TaxID=3155396 RepID=UPI003415A14E
MSADIFVDRTGRRRRVLRWLAVAAAAALVGALGLLVAGLVAGAPLPLSGWSDHDAVPPGSESAVIGPAPTPAAPPASPGGPSTAVPPATTPGARPAANPSATASSSVRPGRGNGRENRPTAKPSHPQHKAG